MQSLSPTDAAVLWRALFGDQRGLLGVHSALRPTPGSKRLSRHRSRFFDYPGRTRAAAAWCLGNSEDGLEAYFCAHLLLARRRVKANAAPVLALWADADGAALGPDSPEPTAIVESSPGHAHLFWRLTRPISPLRAEELNRRLLVAVGADRSGWDLSQLLRPPGTRNRKYEDAPTVRLLELDPGVAYHPRELDIALPEPPTPFPQPRAHDLPAEIRNVDLGRLSPRMRGLIAHGNAASGRPYETRSEADFAVAIAMFGAGYDEADVRAVLTDPANGISERYFERGRYGSQYLAITLDNARDRALPREALAGYRRGRRTAPAVTPEAS